jgi:hypothetical protein
MGNGKHTEGKKEGARTRRDEEGGAVGAKQEDGNEQLCSQHNYRLLEF